MGLSFDRHRPSVHWLGHQSRTLLREHAASIPSGPRFALLTYQFAAYAVAKPLPRRTSLRERLEAFPRNGVPLTKSVVIYWNDHQVPFIEAGTDADLATSLGLPRLGPFPFGPSRQSLVDDVHIAGELASAGQWGRCPQCRRDRQWPQRHEKLRKAQIVTCLKISGTPGIGTRQASFLGSRSSAPMTR